MPWSRSQGFNLTSVTDVNGPHHQTLGDRLPLMMCPEAAGSSTPPGRPASDTSSSVTSPPQANRHSAVVGVPPEAAPREELGHRRTRTEGSYVTTVTIGPTSEPVTHGHDRSKAVRIVVNGDWRREGGAAPSQVVVSGDKNGFFVGDPCSLTHPHWETPKDTHEAKVLETWPSNSSGASATDDALSSDDGQRSTSTLVYTSVSSKLHRSDDLEESGAGVSTLWGICVACGAATFLRLPGLLLQFGVGTFGAAFLVSLLCIAAPLAFLEGGLAQFSSCGTLGIWRLVPIARGVGWSAVVMTLLWGAEGAGLAAPWFNYLLRYWAPDALEVLEGSSLCYSDSNVTALISAISYYSDCVYKLSLDWDSTNFNFTLPLPIGLYSVLTIGIFSILWSPFVTSLIGMAGTLLAVVGCLTQLLLGIFLILKSSGHYEFWCSQTLQFLIPDTHVLIKPQVWITAVSQSLLLLGPGTGFLLDPSSCNAFRFHLRRHIFTVVIVSILSSALVAVTTLFQLLFLDLANSEMIEEAVQNSVNWEETNINRTSLSSIWFVSPRRVIYDEMAVGLREGTAFVTSQNLLTQADISPEWITSALLTISCLGFLGAAVATVCSCIYAGILAAKEAKNIPSSLAAAILFVLLVAAVLPCGAKGGSAFVNLLDTSVISVCLLWPPLAMTLTLAVFHGMTKIRKDFTFMLESKISWIWVPLWGLVIPTTLVVMLVWLAGVDWREMAAVDGAQWRLWTVWALRAVVFLPVPLTAILVINSQIAYGFKDKISSSLQSSREWGDWGPQDPIEHHNWRQWREDETRPLASLERRLASRPLTYTHSTLSFGSSSVSRIRSKYQNDVKGASDL